MADVGTATLEPTRLVEIAAGGIVPPIVVTGLVWTGTSKVAAHSCRGSRGAATRMVAADERCAVIDARFVEYIERFIPES